MNLRAAATVIVLRPHSQGPQVALLRRNPQLPFLGNFWVFPGGRVDEGEDEAAAALREAFEETGLLLVPGGDEVPAARRRALHELSFADALGQLGLEASPQRLVPCGRWKTPDLGRRRFDTRFFLALIPGDAELLPPEGNEGELVEAEWLSPREALGRWAGDAWLLAPPTRVSLQALAESLARVRGNLDEACLAHAAAQVAASHPPEGEWEDFLDFRPGIRLLPLLTPTLPPATHTNCLVIGSGSEVVVIDPASPYPEEQARLDERLDALAEAGQHVREILLTHHHHDHCSGANHLAERLGVPVAAHANTWVRLEGRVRVDRPIEDGEVIDLPADLPGALPRRLRAHLTEGHADGHLIFHEELSHTLIAGDMVAGVGTIVIDPPEGRMGDYLASLRRMAALEASILYPSHGSPVGDPRGYAEYYIRHRLGREAKILDALRALGPCPVEDLLPHAYADKPASVYPLARRAALAHLFKLEADGAARRQEEDWAPA
jgi:ribonuclease/clavin/mitogillin